MSDPASSSAAQYERWPGLLSLTLGVVLGPIVALVHQEALYAANMWACGRSMHVALHAIPLLSLVVIAGAGFGAHRNWVETGKGAEDERHATMTRARFMAMMGMAISAIAALVVAAQWFAVFMFDPCMRA